MENKPTAAKRTLAHRLDLCLGHMDEIETIMDGNLNSQALGAVAKDGGSASVVPTEEKLAYLEDRLDILGKRLDQFRDRLHGVVAQL
jgi:hypothetical protein